MLIFKWIFWKPACSYNSARIPAATALTTKSDLIFLKVYLVFEYICSDLTHLCRDKMATIFRMTFSNAYSWINMYKFWLRCHWSLFPRVQLTILQHWFRWWLGADQATSHYLNQWWSFYWCIYASLGVNELTTVFKMADKISQQIECDIWVSPRTVKVWFLP